MFTQCYLDNNRILWRLMETLFLASSTTQEDTGFLFPGDHNSQFNEKTPDRLISL